MQTFRSPISTMLSSSQEVACRRVIGGPSAQKPTIRRGGLAKFRSSVGCGELQYRDSKLQARKLALIAATGKSELITQLPTISRGLQQPKFCRMRLHRENSTD